MLNSHLAALAVIVGAGLTLATSAAGQGRFAADLVLLDFGAEWCGPCRSMEGTVQQLTAAGYPIRKVNIDQERDLARQFQVTRVPTFVLVQNNQEIDRLEGPASAAELQKLFSKARPATTPSAVPASNGEQIAARSQPAAGARPFRPAGSTFGPASPASASGPAGANAPGAFPTGRLLISGVRLTVEDAKGSSYGSGTLVDARNGEALVLTCAHIFRDSQGKGNVWVDIFGPHPQLKLQGRVVGYDLKRDVGLVSIRPQGPVTTFPVAPAGYAVRAGDRVVSVGCDNGAESSVREARVMALNKFLGPDNIEVSGQPIQGRSGGGLFSADGYVIGVCNAADPSDNEGLFAAVATIHAQLDQAGLTALYRRANEAAPVLLANAPSAKPAMPPEMPLSPLAALAGHGPVGGIAGGPALAAAPVAGLNSDAAGRLTPQERATLGVLAQKSQTAEVICIVRSLADPQAKSEIIVLDRATPAFLQQLSAERSTQDARHLTSLDVSRPAVPRAQPPANSGAPTAPAPPTGANVPPAATWQPNWR